MLDSCLGRSPLINIGTRWVRYSTGSAWLQQIISSPVIRTLSFTSSERTVARRAGALTGLWKSVEESSSTIVESNLSKDRERGSSPKIGTSVILCAEELGDDIARVLEIMRQGGSWRYHKAKELRGLRLKLEASLVLKVLKNPDVTPSSAWDFFRWTKKQMGYKHTSETYNRMILILSGIRKFRPIWFLMQDMHKEGCLLTPSTCVQLANNLGSVGMVERAIRSLNWIRHLGQPVTARQYNNLIHVLLSNRFYAKAYVAYREMLKAELEPDTHTFRLIITCLNKANATDLIFDVFKHMQFRGCEPDACTLSMLVDILCKVGKFDEAQTVFSKMKTLGFRPNAGKYDALLSYLVQVGRTEEALSLLQERTSYGYAPNELTKSILNNHLCTLPNSGDGHGIVESLFPQLELQTL